MYWCITQCEIPPGGGVVETATGAKLLSVASENGKLVASFAHEDRGWGGEKHEFLVEQANSCCRDNLSLIPFFGSVEIGGQLRHVFYEGVRR